jgi:hypothetical protein
MKIPRKSDKNHYDKASEYELAAIVVLNSDQTRSYPAIEYHAKSLRGPIMAKALPLWPNRFHLCRATAKLGRALHRPNSTRIQHAINRAMEMIANAATEPKRRPAVAQAQAAAA